MIDLAQLIIALTGSKSTTVFSPSPVDDPMQRKPDIALARRELGWEPSVSIAEGLKHTIAYFDRLLTR
jgi:UDP-glucuronate decarboxylase